MKGVPVVDRISLLVNVYIISTPDTLSVVPQFVYVALYCGDHLHPVCPQVHLPAFLHRRLFLSNRDK